MSMLEVRNVHKAFENEQVLRGIDLTVDKGDVVAILGPSGSGKTTLLRCINFLETADQGELIFDGKHYDMHAAHKKEIAESKQKALAANAGEQVNKAESINGLSVLLLKADGMETGAMKGYAETLRNKLTDGLVFVSNVNGDKITFVCAASKAAIEKGLKAGDLVKAAAQLCGGNGGGRPDMAQAGGKDITSADKALEEVRSRITNA